MRGGLGTQTILFARGVFATNILMDSRLLVIGPSRFWTVGRGPQAGRLNVVFAILFEMLLVYA